jgi:glycosyltransferase involved in cell wall biosynthesis
MIASTSVDDPASQSRPADTAKLGAKRRGRCFLVAPSGQRGGGMGRVSDYLMQAACADDRMPNYVAVDSRGSGHVFWSPLYLLLAMVRIGLGAIRRDVALVHLNVGERGSLWRKGSLILWARALRLPIVLHLHAAQLLQHHASLPQPLRKLVRTIFRSADCCIVLGDFWRRFVIEELGVDAGKVVILYNGVPRAAFSRQSRPSGCQLRILFLGNLMERKGVSDLLEALARQPLSGMDWRATLAGGGAIESYRRKAESLGLLSRVDFPGWVDQRDAGALLAASDVLVLPSYDEGLPLVILEALTAGVPVVCSPVGAIPEVLEDGKSAVFVQPRDSQGLADALARLGREPALRERLAAEGRALYDREFSLEIFAARVVRIYRRYCSFDVPTRVAIDE